MDLRDDPDLHDALSTLAERRATLGETLRRLVLGLSDLHRRLPGLEGAELVELAEVLHLAGLPPPVAARLHDAVEALHEAEERAWAARRASSRREADARYAMRVRDTLEALSAGDSRAWLAHLDRMALDARMATL